jgi:hypothetical protein
VSMALQRVIEVLVANRVRWRGRRNCISVLGIVIPSRLDLSPEISCEVDEELFTLTQGSKDILFQS